MGAYVVNYPVRPGQSKKKRGLGGQRADLGVERRAAFYSQLKSKVGNIIAKATALLIHHIDGGGLLQKVKAVSY